MDTDKTRFISWFLTDLCKRSNADLYRKAAYLAQQRCPELDIRVFSDRALTSYVYFRPST
jgi:ABC-type cobalamin transport system ATPase subunit